MHILPENLRAAARHTHKYGCAAMPDSRPHCNMVLKAVLRSNCW